MLADNSKNRSKFIKWDIDIVRGNGSIAQALSMIPPIREKPPVRNFSNNLPCKFINLGFKYFEICLIATVNKFKYLPSLINPVDEMQKEHEKMIKLRKEVQK